ncbi:MAG: elongation factor G, partial [Oscillospiraceae bacterium]|nr:elongation factor G [Oscillospiraceae bacterium]
MAVTADNELVEITVGDDDSPLAIVFKTVSDQYGKVSFFKVLSGKVKSDMFLFNPRTGETEKIGHLYHVVGKKRVDVDEITTGDIGAVAKLAVTRTGDTLCASNKKVHLTGINFPIPTYSLAVNPKVKGGEEKIASGLARLAEEDVTFKTVNNSETRQFVVTGYGDIHIDVLCSKLKARFNVDVDLVEPRVPYREKIRKKVKVQGRHKKQSGGHGQFGDVWIEFQPGDVEDLVFEEKIVGGAVPKNFFPAVEKGLRDSIAKGVLAGFPVVYLKATLVDG